MEPLCLRRPVIRSLVAVAMLAGCGGTQNAMNATTALIPRSLTHVSHGKSWMLPEAKGEALLYVSGVDGSASDVAILTYPQGRQVGTISTDAEAEGDCVDRSGNVWVVISDGLHAYVSEYPHGKTASTKTLALGNYVPTGCSVDGTTGNLAVVVYNAGVVIFQNATGTGKLYGVPADSYLCAYDDKGDLFVDGYQHLEVAELPHGSSQFISIRFNKTGVSDGGIQWDGKYMAISTTTARHQHVVYRFRVAQSSAQVVQTIHFLHVWKAWHFWIQGHTMVAPIPRVPEVGLWHYPDGGKLYDSIDTTGGSGNGLAVSDASPHARPR